jgi:hypothetical protein
MSFLKVNSGAGVALVALALLVAACQPALANTINLECSYDGYPNRSLFAVDVNMDKNTVTVNHPGENLPGNVYLAPNVEGPYAALIDDKTISWHSPTDRYQRSADTSLDRMTGKAIETVHIGSQTFHDVWSCHVAQRQF